MVIGWNGEALGPMSKDKSSGVLWIYFSFTLLLLFAAWS
jgi:hypothetical protein